MRSTRNDPVTVLEEFYPTPSDIPEGTRCLTLHIPDSDEWYGLAIGALWELMRWQNYEKVGLDADVTIDRWLEVFNTMELTCMDTIPVGTLAMWLTATPPARWIICDGGGYAKADYPELWELWGETYGADTETHFLVPQMGSKSPFGASGLVPVNTSAGELLHTLTIGEMPAHTHPFERRTTNGAGSTFSAFPGQVALAADGVTKSTGGGVGHNTLHPVFGVYYIVYGGAAP